MSLLSNFISTQLIQALEHEFVNHAPDVQSLIVTEIQNFLTQGAAWVESKINHQQAPSNQEQPK